MKIPYHEQESAYTCGAASLRMAFEYFGIKKSEKQMARLLGTNKVKGTWEKDFPRIAEKYKLSYVVEHDGSLKDLIEFYNEGHVIIICFHDPTEKEDHYSVIKKINKKEILLADPWFGPEKKFKTSFFKKIWRTISEKDLRWFIALKQNNFNKS